jgi:site-specific recombinase XerD
MKNDDILKDFLNYLDLNNGYSPNTIKAYRLGVVHFLFFLKDKGFKIKRINKKAIEEYIFFLRNKKNNSSKSIRLKIAILRSLFRYLNESLKILKDNPIQKGDFRYKVEKKDAKSLSENQIESLLKVLLVEKNRLLELLSFTEGKKTLLNKQIFALNRDYVLIKLLLSNGLRISEALNIRINDIDFIDKSILIHGKGNKLREIFFDINEVEKDFLNYINEIKKLPLNHDYMFVSIKNYSKLTSRGFQLLLKKYLNMAEITTAITPHNLRHTFASISIEKGCNIKAVSQLLGHSNIQITIDTYTHLSNEHVREVIKRCNPLSNEVIPLEERIENRLKSLVYLAKTG